MVDSLRYLQSVGEQVRQAFVGNKTILSFQEYMEGFFEKPRIHARDAAQYIRDCFDFYGTATAQNPGGPLRRFKIFDRPFDQGPTSLQEGEGGAPVCGHEEVQNASYRILNGFVRAGRINKLILLHEATRPESSFQLSQAMLEGELCHKCRQIYAALLQSYNGDVLKVLRHVQVERFYISRRYMIGAVTVEPQMGVDADYRQVTHDRSHGALPGALQNLALFEPYGPLVAGNRGVIEFSDLLKRPLEHYKYLLGTVETGVARMSHFLLHLDCALIASTNEKHLSAFKEMSDFASFKGRIELVRVPYLRTVGEERQVYEFRLPETVGKHIAPHASWVAAEGAGLTRLKKPVTDPHKGELC